MRNLLCILMVYGGILYFCRGYDPLVWADDVVSDEAGSLEIDFGKCTPGRMRIDAGQGSTTYEVDGLGQNGCLMKYGGEVENPGWDQSLNMTCVVPVSQGILTFKKTGTGVDFIRIAPFCNTIINTGVKK